MTRKTTDIDIQKKFIASLKSALSKKKVKVSDGDKRHAAHLRITVGATDAAQVKATLNKLLGSAFNCDVQPSNESMSGKYPTYVLTLQKDYTEQSSKFFQGTSIYVVNAVSNKGTLGNKDLTPTKFGLNGAEIPEQKLYKTIKDKFSKVNELKSIEDNIQQFCLDLLIQVGKPPIIPSNSQVSIKSEAGATIKPADLKIIAKNFGEILGALWYMTNDRRKNRVEYPREENLPLIDYFIHTTGALSLSVSAKSEGGAPPGADEAIMTLKELKITNNAGDSFTLSQKKAARDTLVTMIIEKKKSGIVQSILSTHKTLKTPAYKWLQNNINEKSLPTVTLTDIDNFIKKYMNLPGKMDARVTALVEALTPFYAETGSGAQIRTYRQSITDIFNARGTLPITGIIIFPMGGNLTKIFNVRNSPYSSLLKESLQSKEILQIHIYLTPTTIKFVKAPFALGEFKFTYNAGMKYPSNRPIGFKMV